MVDTVPLGLYDWWSHDFWAVWFAILLKGWSYCPPTPHKIHLPVLDSYEIFQRSLTLLDRGARFKGIADEGIPTKEYALIIFQRKPPPIKETLLQR